MSSRRDVIHVSLGPSANAVSAHLLNLEGLTGTGEEAMCDIATTHRLEGKFWVPRTMMVDEPTVFPAEAAVDTAGASGTWSGAVEAVDSLRGPLTGEQRADPLQAFRNTSSMLAYSSHSRFYQETPPSRGITYDINSTSDGRHVVWDDEDEDEPEDELTEQLREQQRQLNRSQWQRNTQEPLQDQMSSFWGELVVDNSVPLHHNPDQDAESAPTASESSVPTPGPPGPGPDLSWVDFIMPPFSARSNVALPFSHRTNMVSNWDHYQISTDRSIDAWKEDVLFERLRLMLEESDFCQGITIATEGHGAYAGLATQLLQEAKEECKSAGRLAFHVLNPQEQALLHAPEQAEGGDPPTTSWHVAGIKRLRFNVQSALTLYDLTQSANVVVPLRLGENGSLFKSSAEIATAIESMTLPFRLDARPDPRYKIGLQNAHFFGQGGEDSRWGTTAQRVSFGEYISCLQPSARYPLVEVDRMAHSDDYFEAVKMGTSVQRDHRMRYDGYGANLRRPRDMPPGEWLNDVAHRGVMHSLSHTYTTDYSQHHNFALSTAVRSNAETNGHFDKGVSDHLTCLIESMGIRYRPERSSAVVATQSMMELIYNGYGAGAYWRALLPRSFAPQVTAFGNTTRVYPYLQSLSKDMKGALGMRFRGLYNRDVVSGILPEIEDCEEALAGCFDMRDTYEPPESSGLIEDADSGYGDDF